MLSCLKRIAMLALLACVFLPVDSRATDLRPVIDYEEEEVFLLNEVIPIKVEVRNENVMTAASYTVTVKIYDLVEDKLVYSETQQGSNLAAFTNIVHTFPSFHAIILGDYEMRATTAFSEDINTGNDLDWIVFDVEEDAANGLEFLAKLIGSAEIRRDTALDRIMGYPQAYPPGTRLRSFDKSELDLTFTDYTYVGWINPDKYARFVHPSYVITQRYGDTAFTIHNINYWPLINEKDFTDDSFIVAGSPEVPVQRDTNTVSSGTSTTIPPDSVCAIIVSGHGHTANQQEGFDADAHMMDVNLRLEQMGPRIPAANIINLRNASHLEIVNAIQMMNGKCKKIIFFFSGHGSEYSMATRDSSVSYLQLFDKLYATGAGTITTIIDACKSGGAIRAAELGVGYDNVNVTVLTSSSKDSSSYSETLDTGLEKKWWVGLYTWTFVQGFGNPAADYDRNGVVTEVEAHIWAVNQNPTFFKGSMDSVMRPQILVHEVVDDLKTDNTVILEEASLEVTPKSEMNVGATLSVDLGYYGFGGWKHDQYAYDTTVTYGSMTRIWDIKLDGALDYRFDVKFNYKYAFDELPEATPGVTQPGVMRYDTDKSMWKAHYPSVWDPMQRSIVASGIERFSKWAIALVKVEPVQGAVAAEIEDRLVQSYPNPFRDMFSVSIDPEAVGDAMISLVDLTGRTALEPFEVTLNGGSQTLQLDGSKLSAGSYYLLVRTPERQLRSLVVKH
ncbi:MAG TPA: T9SS type A sorting domain-containing protein [Candidatus Kapabacteria bacterium]|nr:T9SS type A sorting domain-containing protein [Candidatus Kapabacteria bacterium]